LTVKAPAAAEHAGAWCDRRGLAVHQFAGAHDVAAEGRADALVAQAHAQDRQLAGMKCRIAATEMPASAGEHGSRARPPAGRGGVRQ
jgi:hypothetical protein